MLQKDIKNKHEILSISKELVLVKSIKQIYLEKIEHICAHITLKTKNKVFWFNNSDEEKIEIYTEKDNQKNAKAAFEEFEVEYNSILHKMRMIIAHRHRKS